MDKANALKEFFELKKCHICSPDFYLEDISRKSNATEMDKIA